MNTPPTQSKPLDQLTKWELLDKCKKYRFVLQKLNKEIESLEQEVRDLKRELKR